MIAEKSFVYISFTVLNTLKLYLLFLQVGEEKGVNLKCHVNELDGDRLVVQTKEEVKGILCSYFLLMV